jgi:cyclophilin family peptidyl-prolyl cis-trans isomerase
MLGTRALNIWRGFRKARCYGNLPNMKKSLLAAAAIALSVPVSAEEVKPAPSPSEIVAAAPASDWVAIVPSDLLVMDLADGPRGPRRVVIQLIPAPFSQGWVGNIRKLAAAQWWDGTSINRVQDNYVVQWGDATEKKPLPDGLATVEEGEYRTPFSDGLLSFVWTLQGRQKIPHRSWIEPVAVGEEFPPIFSDAYGHDVSFFAGMPVSSKSDFSDHQKPEEVEVSPSELWPVHCYGMVGVGRNMSPDTGTGAELYTVIGHAPRHLDRNIALVGRVIEGIEHLSSLPRGTGALGFYEKEDERVPIGSVRIGADIAGLPTYEYLSTDSDAFAAYADARANRLDPFFNVPAGGADVCNIPVPVRRKAG